VASTPGSYCPEGTGAPLPCEEGTYSNRTDLVSASQARVRAITPTVSPAPTLTPNPNPSPPPPPNQCTKTAPGYYAPVGSTKVRACPPGSYDKFGGQGRCKLCDAGK
jgi:hypothetical protein